VTELPQERLQLRRVPPVPCLGEDDRAVPVQDPRRASEYLYLHSFHVHLEDGDRPTQYMVEPPDRKYLVDRRRVRQAAAEADLMFAWEMVCSDTRAFSDAYPMSLHFVLEVVGRDVASQHIGVALDGSMAYTVVDGHNAPNHTVAVPRCAPTST
jgi:hypothetical protein